MIQHFEADLRNYHKIFDGGRCSGWQCEELIVRAIRSDNTAQHQAFWREAGHDDKADIVVRTNGRRHFIEVKSGKISKDKLTLSGHRLGRFRGDLKEISDYLNNKEANIIAIPYEKKDDGNGRHHIYTLCYVPISVLQTIDPEAWEKHGTELKQIGENGVEYALRPSMSWQIWWKIPLEKLEIGKPISIP